MSAFQVYLTSWSFQNLSNRPLKLFTDSALTTVSGKLFRSRVLTLLEKENLRRSYLTWLSYLVYVTSSNCSWNRLIWNFTVTSLSCLFVIISYISILSPRTKGEAVNVQKDIVLHGFVRKTVRERSPCIVVISTWRATALKKMTKDISGFPRAPMTSSIHPGITSTRCRMVPAMWIEWICKWICKAHNVGDWPTESEANLRQCVNGGGPSERESVKSDVLYREIETPEPIAKISQLNWLFLQYKAVYQIMSRSTRWTLWYSYNTVWSELCGSIIHDRKCYNCLNSWPVNSDCGQWIEACCFQVGLNRSRTLLQ